MKYFLPALVLMLLAAQASAALLPPSNGSGSVLPGDGSSGGGKVLPSTGGKGVPGTGHGELVPVTGSDASGDDAFSQATRIKGRAERVVLISTNKKATKEEGEPFHGNYEGNPGGKSMWWRYEGIADGTLTISTKGSDFDTVIGVYNGDDVAALTPIAADNDGGPGVTSKVTVRVLPNSLYYIAVDGYNGASGKIVLRLNFEPTSISTTGIPVNDDFANRKKLFGARTMDYGTNSGATLEPNDPGISYYSSFWVGQNVWWEWVSPTTGTVTVSTLGSSYDTTLFVYRADRPEVGRLTLIDADDEGEEGTHASTLQFHAYAGESYYIAVDGYMWTSGRANGDVVLSLDLQPHTSYSYATFGSPVDGVDPFYYYYVFKTEVPPKNDAFEYRIGIKGRSFSTEGNTENAYWQTSEEPEHGEKSQSYFSTWWTWTAPRAGTLRVVVDPSDSSSLIPIVALYTGDRLNKLKTLDYDVAGDSGQRAVVSTKVRKGEIIQMAVAGDGGTSGAFGFDLDFSVAEVKFKVQPKPVTVAAGADATFSVKPTKSSDSSIKYQWQMKRRGQWTKLSNGNRFSGVKSPTLTVIDAPAGLDKAQFRCVIRNTTGSAKSDPVVLRVIE